MVPAFHRRADTILTRIKLVLNVSLGIWYYYQLNLVSRYANQPMAESE